MILLIFIFSMIIIGYILSKYASYLEEKENEHSCYDAQFVRNTVRGIRGMFVSESMLQFRRNIVNQKKSKF